MLENFSNSAMQESKNPKWLDAPVRITEQTWPEDALPVVSISCATYNHEKFIRECLDGFLMQETTFPVEILIHDDASTDNTANIVREYEKCYPSLVKPIYQTENQYSKGRKPSINFNFPRARGKYIALCEGDDFWTDVFKVQRQVEYLEENPDYVLVAENAIWHDLFDDRKKNFSDLPERDINILEMLQKRQFATASVLFRNLGEKLHTGEVSGDTILWCHLAKSGKVKYKTNISSVYRRHNGGVTEGNKVEWAKKMMKWNDYFIKTYPEIDQSIFIERNLNNFRDAALYLFKERRYKELFIAIDELCSSSQEPRYFRNHLYNFIEGWIIKEFKEKEETQNQLMDIRNSSSFKIGRMLTYPARLALSLPQKIRIKIKLLIEKMTPKRIRHKRILKDQGIVFIDKRKIIKSVDQLKPLSSYRTDRSPRLIISLTSFPGRINDVFFTSYSLLNQTVKPDMLILWLAEEQFPNKEKNLPSRLLELTQYGLTIRWCKDIKSYKKLIYSLREFPNDIIVTADDDIYYPENWLELLYESYLKEPQHIHCHRAHRVVFDGNGDIAKYGKWEKCIISQESSHLNFPTGCGGVLYPPNALHEDTTLENLFMATCPHADDIWFWIMSILNRKKAKIVANNIVRFIYINNFIEYELDDGFRLYNINKQANDDQLTKAISLYGKNKLYEIILDG